MRENETLIEIEKIDNDNIEAKDLVRDNLLAVTSLGNVELFLSFKKEKYTGVEIGNDNSLLSTVRQLGRVEPLIRLLENWLKHPLDFVPVRQDVSSGDRIKINISMDLTEIDDAVKVVLFLPLESIHQLSHPNPELMAMMQWNSVPCNICVESVEIDVDQINHLEVGSMILLPASFEAFWRCKVHLITNIASVFSAELDASHQRLIFDLFNSTEDTPNSSQDISYGRELVDVMLLRSMTLPLDLLLGWTEHPVFIFEQTLSSFTVVLFNDGERIAYGSLLPIGNGYGVLIKNIVGEL